MSERRVRADQLPKGAGTAEEVPPVPASSVILLRRDPFEVLLMRRNETSSFVPGSWVFPGGTLDEEDRARGEDAALRRCALREVLEETGIWLGTPLPDLAEMRARLLGGHADANTLAPYMGDALDELVLTSRWVTPVGVPKRFDTWFFLATVGDDAEGTPDEAEGLELAWLRPETALRRHEEGTLPMVFPTIRNLEALSAYRNRAELLAARRNATVTPIQPVITVENGQAKITIPGEQDDS